VAFAVPASLNKNKNKPDIKENFSYAYREVFIGYYKIVIEPVVSFTFKINYVRINTNRQQ
jgi:hypothetical protein